MHDGITLIQYGIELILVYSFYNFVYNVYIENNNFLGPQVPRDGQMSGLVRIYDECEVFA